MAEELWFDTAVGAVRLRWSEAGLTELHLPELDAREARDHVQRARPAEAPAFVRDAAARIARHLDGKPQDFAEVRLDLRALPEFAREVYQAARQIPAGRTATYGELAKALGKPGASRAVGQALGRNPLLLLVPCHRVLAAGNKPGGFSAPGGAAQKLQLLALEGVRLGADEPAAPRADGAQWDLTPAEAPRPAHGLPYEPRKALRHLERADARFAAWRKKAGPVRLRIDPLRSPYEALARSIVYQQLSGKAAATILGRVLQLFAPARFFTPEALLAMDETRLRAAGLSANKLLALQDLSRKTHEGLVPPSVDALEELSDDEIVERLTQVRGIGRWTVEMLLLFRLGRPDVWPVDDLGVRKGFARMRGMRALPPPKKLMQLGEPFRPYRSLLAWYCWRFTELPQK